MRGSCGSGKSTLAKRIATKLEIRHIELDELFHLPGWNQRSKEEFEALLEEATTV